MVMQTRLRTNQGYRALHLHIHLIRYSKVHLIPTSQTSPFFRILFLCFLFFLSFYILQKSPILLTWKLVGLDRDLVTLYKLPPSLLPS